MREVATLLQQFASPVQINATVDGEDDRVALRPPGRNQRVVPPLAHTVRVNVGLVVALLLPLRLLVAEREPGREVEHR